MVSRNTGMDVCEANLQNTFRGRPAANDPAVGVGPLNTFAKLFDSGFVMPTLEEGHQEKLLDLQNVEIADSGTVEVHIIQ